jgi:predicted membrane channel-forming protein YqfA (hemolysin III family)
VTRSATFVQRPQTLGEKIANNVSHGVGLVAAIAVVWHLFVLAGTACHYVAVRFYAA